jgi:hypothetical protein
MKLSGILYCFIGGNCGPSLASSTAFEVAVCRAIPREAVLPKPDCNSYFYEIASLHVRVHVYSLNSQSPHAAEQSGKVPAR